MKNIKTEIFYLGYDTACKTEDSKFIKDLLEKANYEFIGSCKYDNTLRVVASNSKGFYYFSLIYPLNIKNGIRRYLGLPKDEVNIIETVHSDTPKKKRRSSLSKIIPKCY